MINHYNFNIVIFVKCSWGRWNVLLFIKMIFVWWWFLVILYTEQPNDISLIDRQSMRVKYKYSSSLHMRLVLSLMFCTNQICLTHLWVTFQCNNYNFSHTYLFKYAFSLTGCVNKLLKDLSCWKIDQISFCGRCCSRQRGRRRPFTGGHGSGDAFPTRCLWWLH